MYLPTASEPVMIDLAKTPADVGKYIYHLGAGIGNISVNDISSFNKAKTKCNKKTE